MRIQHNQSKKARSLEKRLQLVATVLILASVLMLTLMTYAILKGMADADGGTGNALTLYNITLIVSYLLTPLAAVLVFTSKTKWGFYISALVFVAATLQCAYLFLLSNAEMLMVPVVASPSGLLLITWGIRMQVKLEDLLESEGMELNA